MIFIKTIYRIVAYCCDDRLHELMNEKQVLYMFPLNNLNLKGVWWKTVEF